MIAGRPRFSKDVGTFERTLELIVICGAPMKVFYDYQVFQIQKRGGVSRYFFSVIESLARRQLANPVVSFGIHNSDLLADFSQTAKICGPTLRFPSVRYTDRPRNCLNRLLTRRLLESEKPNIWHPTYLWTPASGSRSPIVLTIYDLIHERFWGSRAGRDGTVNLRRRSLKNASAILTISESTRADVAEMYGVPDERLFVSPLANSLRISPDPTRLRRRPYLLFVGPRGHYKNFSLLLRTYSKSDSLRHEFEVICVGGAKPSTDERMRGINFVGNVNDQELANLYSDAFALVYPSRFEGFGLPLLEAMFYGCPVVTTRGGSLPEVGGDAVIYVDTDSVDDLLSAIESLKVRGLREAFAKRGREREKLYSWDRCADVTLAAYRTAAR